MSGRVTKPTTRRSSAENGIVSGPRSRNNDKYAAAIAALAPGKKGKKSSSSTAPPANKRKAKQSVDDVTSKQPTKKKKIATTPKTFSKTMDDDGDDDDDTSFKTSPTQPELLTHTEMDTDTFDLPSDKVFVTSSPPQTSPTPIANKNDASTNINNALQEVTTKIVSPQISTTNKNDVPPNNTNDAMPIDPTKTVPSNKDDVSPTPSPTSNINTAVEVNVINVSNQGGIQISTANKNNVSPPPTLNINATAKVNVGNGGSVVRDKGRWPDEIDENKWAVPSADGTTINCDACKGKGRTLGVIRMRHDFCLDAWNGHCKSKAHKDNVAMKEAAKLKDDGKDDEPTLAQSSMTSFFKVKPKKEKGTGGQNNGNTNEEGNVGTGTAAVVVDLTSSGTVVDLTGDKQPQ